MLDKEISRTVKYIYFHTNDEISIQINKQIDLIEKCEYFMSMFENIRFIIYILFINYKESIAYFYARKWQKIIIVIYINMIIKKVLMMII